MVINLLVSICMVYLLMAILFESFIYPLVIMLSVPPAAAGGVIGLSVLNLNILQPLDMLTMLGFVILIGIVVNNAILLVHQSLQHMKEERKGVPIITKIIAHKSISLSIKVIIGLDKSSIFKP